MIIFLFLTTRNSEPSSQLARHMIRFLFLPIVRLVAINRLNQLNRFQPSPNGADPAVVQAPAQGPASFPLILPSHRQATILREKQTRSEVLDRVAEFCGLIRANAQTSQEVMGKQNPVYSEQKKRAIELTLPWHNSTTQIAQRNYDIVNGRLSKNMNFLIQLSFGA